MFSSKQYQQTSNTLLKLRTLNKILKPTTKIIKTYRCVLNFRLKFIYLDQLKPSSGEQREAISRSQRRLCLFERLR